EVGFLMGETAARHQLLARRAASGEPYGDLVARCGRAGRCEAASFAFLAFCYVIEPALQGAEHRLDLREARRERVVHYLEVRGETLGGAAPARERDRREHEAENEKYRSHGEERDVERNVRKLHHRRESCEVDHIGRACAGFPTPAAAAILRVQKACHSGTTTRFGSS